MTFKDSFREFIADRFFEKELDAAFEVGKREGYRIGAAEAKRHWFDFIETNINSLHNAADTKHKHGLGLALSYLDSVRSDKDLL